MPHQLFVWRENEGTSDSYITTADNANDAAPESGSERCVAVYVLKEYVSIESRVTVKKL